MAIRAALLIQSEAALFVHQNVGINVGISTKIVGITGLIFSCKAEYRIAQSYTMCYHIGYEDGE